jgi:hypothetical protein
VQGATWSVVGDDDGLSIVRGNGRVRSRVCARLARCRAALVHIVDLEIASGMCVVRLDFRAEQLGRHRWVKVQVVDDLKEDSKPKAEQNDDQRVELEVVVLFRRVKVVGYRKQTVFRVKDHVVDDVSISSPPLNVREMLESKISIDKTEPSLTHRSSG